MADLGFAQTPRGLDDTESALIKRSPYQGLFERDRRIVMQRLG
jgi:hypothetical protein